MWASATAVKRFAQLPRLAELDRLLEPTKDQILSLAALPGLRQFNISASPDSAPDDSVIAEFNRRAPNCRLLFRGEVLGRDPVREIAERLHQAGWKLLGQVTVDGKNGVAPLAELGSRCLPAS